MKLKVKLLYKNKVEPTTLLDTSRNGKIELINEILTKNFLRVLDNDDKVIGIFISREG